MPSDLQVVPFEREHLGDAMHLFEAESWSYANDKERTFRALTARGSLTLVAIAGARLIGIAQVMSDGEIQAFLSVLLVSRDHRRAGVGRHLVDAAIQHTIGLRLNVISCADPFYEAIGFRPVSGFRFDRER